MKEIATVTLPVAVMNEVLAYLGQRPYKEVTPLINSIHQNATLTEVADGEEEGS